MPQSLFKYGFTGILWATISVTSLAATHQQQPAQPTTYNHKNLACPRVSEVQKPIIQMEAGKNKGHYTWKEKGVKWRIIIPKDAPKPVTLHGFDQAQWSRKNKALTCSYPIYQYQQNHSKKVDKILLSAQFKTQKPDTIPWKAIKGNRMICQGSPHLCVFELASKQ